MRKYMFNITALECNSLFPVDVRGSQTSLLKLPIDSIGPSSAVE